MSSYADSVDLSPQTIAAKEQTSTSFLIEAAEDASLSAEEDRISKEELHAAFLCQGLGADVFRIVKSWAFQLLRLIRLKALLSLFLKHCPFSTVHSRVACFYCHGQGYFSYSQCTVSFHFPAKPSVLQASRMFLSWWLAVGWH